MSYEYFPTLESIEKSQEELILNELSGFERVGIFAVMCLMFAMSMSMLVVLN